MPTSTVGKIALVIGLGLLGAVVINAATGKRSKRGGRRHRNRRHNGRRGPMNRYQRAELAGTRDARADLPMRDLDAAVAILGPDAPSSRLNELRDFYVDGYMDIIRHRQAHARRSNRDDAVGEYVVQWRITVDHPERRDSSYRPVAPGTAVWEGKAFTNRTRALSYAKRLLAGEDDFGSEYVSAVAVTTGRLHGGYKWALRRVDRERDPVTGRIQAITDRYR